MFFSHVCQIFGSLPKKKKKKRERFCGKQMRAILQTRAGELRQVIFFFGLITLKI